MTSATARPVLRPTPRPQGSSTLPPVGRSWAWAATLGFVVVYVVAVRTWIGQVVDSWLMDVAGRSVASTSWAEAVLWMVSSALVLVAIAATATVAWAVHGRAAAVRAAATIIVTVVAARVLKTVLTRPPLGDLAANSLPSGHVAAVAGIVVAAVIAAPVSRRRLVALSGSVAVAVTGAATVVLAWHRPSDVAAAVLLAIAVGGWLGRGRRSGGSHR